MDRWKGRTVLITGASAGIGKETAKRLVEYGMVVFGVARNIAKVQELSEQMKDTHGKLIPLKCDVRKEEDIKSTFEYVESNFGGVDVCINNAGLCHDAPLLTGATHDWRDMLETNVLAPTVITRYFFSNLKARGVDDGHVIFLNSMSGHRVTSSKNSHFYCATKFAISALVEGVRQELREIKCNCRVSSISPGLVRTEFRGRLHKAKDMEESMKDYDKLVYNGKVLESEDIASAIVFVLTAPPRMEVNDIWIRPTSQEL